MAFAESLATRPAEVRVTSSEEWTEVRAPLSKFAGLDPAGLRAFANLRGPGTGTVPDRDRRRQAEMNG